MTLQINFVRDVAAECLTKLSTAGYVFQPSDDEDAILTYVSIHHRRVRPTPRRVYKASYAVPSHLQVGEQQLLEKVAAGGDLWPHQSRKIIKVGVEDGMLNDYGIQHFHLGTTPDPKHPSLIKGTKELLFAVVKDNAFYALGIFDHTWTNRQLFEVIQSNWPEILAPYALSGGPHMKILGLSHNYNDEEAALMRSAGINVLQQREDGTVHMGMGGGISANGKSVTVRRDTDRIIVTAQNIENEVNKYLEEKIKAGELPNNSDVRLVFDGSSTFAVTNPPNFKLNMDGSLTIPSL